MGNSILGIGASALSAAQAGLLTTGHNIANASTPGYNRQQIIQSASLAQVTGSGYIGQGVTVDNVKRIYSQFLANQVSQAQTQSSQLSTYYSQISQIDNLLADSSAGLSPALQDFFKGLQDLASNPADQASRQAVLSNGQALVARFQSLDSRLNELRDGVNSQITSSVTLVNSYASQIAALNDAIVRAETATNGRPANDLLDQRDQLVAQLNQEVRATIVKQDNGAYNVFIGNGQALVVGQQAFKLSTAASATDAGKLAVGYTANGVTMPIKEDSLGGGNLGGLLQFRSGSLEPAQNELGRIAIGLAGAFNDQHKLGQDVNGAAGTDFFKLAAPQVSASSLNSGNAVIGASFASYSALTTSDYKLQYDGSNYTLTRLDDGSTQTFASFPQTMDGVTLNLSSGSAAAGDSYLIRPTANGARDIGMAIQNTSLVAAAAPVRTSASLSNTGSGTISAGSVDANYLASPLAGPQTLTYAAATSTLSGFPATAPVIVTSNGVSTTYPAGTPVPYMANATITFSGISFTLSGTPADGDTFAVDRNTGGVGDSRNAVALGGLQTRNTLAGGTANFQSAYAQLVSTVGNKTRELQVTSEAQSTALTQAQQAQQADSGVNLDEEAANLLRYQQAYQAAGKVMQIASTLFDTLLQLGN
jgi:flagellar hook-associated protein 1 FlgK